MTANKILSEAGQSDYIAKVIQPAGQHEYYVALGDFGTPDKAVRSSEVAKSAALKGLEGRETEEAKRVATLMLKGQIVDARAMFVAQK